MVFVYTKVDSAAADALPLPAAPPAAPRICVRIWNEDPWGLCKFQSPRPDRWDSFGGSESMKTKILRILAGLCIASLLFAVACGGGSSSSSGNSNSQTGTVHAMISDDPTEDWATIGVKVLSISLVPQGGGTAVPVYTAPSTAPMINLVQLDQLSEILGNTTIPVGTYSQAQLTLSANNNGTTCDVELVVSGDPAAGFDLPAGTNVPCNEIQITGATGSAGSLTVPLTLNLTTPLTVTSNSSNALDLEFDLRNPALIVEHYPATATAPTWAVNFSGPVRHHPRPDLSKVLLRHHYGQVASVSTDNTSITINKAYPVYPVATPETATVSTTPLTILADSTNGTIMYDLDGNGSVSTVTSFASLASTLPNMYVRIAARYSTSGTLTATRIYYGSTFNEVWQNPEGHVLHINTTTNVMHITTEDGKATAVKIGPNTNFYFGSSNTPLNSSGGGQTFFDGTTPGGLPNVARGFKVNTTIDPASTATPPVALTVEIDIARYDGTITNPGSSGFTYTRKFAMADTRGGIDNYSGVLDYISSTSANTDQEDNAITGFYWWDFTYPTLADTGSNAVSDFVSATDGSVNFGGTIGTLRTVGLSNSTWNDPAAADSWSAKWAVLLPVPAPIGAITTAFNSGNNTFAYTVPNTSAISGVKSSTVHSADAAAALPVTVDLTTDTLIYLINRANGVITISTPTLSQAGSALTVGVPVKVYGIPQADGSIKCYSLLFFTGTTSTR